MSAEVSMMEAQTNNNDEGVGISILDVIPVRRFLHIWKMIVANVDTLTSWQNAVTTEDEEWKRVLDPKTKLWGFPKVIPFVSMYMDFGDILNLREVCSSWTHGVDKFVEEVDRPTPYNEGEPVGNLITSYYVRSLYTIGMNRHVDATTLDFTQGLDVDAFMTAMGDHPRNPFIGRQFRIHQFAWFSAPATIQERVDRLFPRLGHHLTYINISSMGNLTAMDFLGLVRSVLADTPNVKQLKLALLATFIEGDANAEILEVEVPHLSQLRTLQLSHNPSPPLGDQPDPDQVLSLFRNLIRVHAAQLGRFEVSGVSAAHWTALDWGDLSELHVDLGFRGEITLRNLLGMEAPQLGKLHLKMFAGTQNMEDLVRLREHFPNLQLKQMAISSIEM